MSEIQPENYNIYITFGQTTYECTPDNTSVYTHEGDDKDYDHIFLVESTDPEEAEAGVAFFRETISNFDDVIELMRQRNYSFVEKETVSNFDREMYHAYFGKDHLPPHQQRSIDSVRSYELTERHEELIRAFGASLLNIPEDLFWDGMEGETDRPYPNRWV